MHVYDHQFFETVDRTAAGSADALIPHLAREFLPRSVLDVGCGRGMWLARWRHHGAGEVFGVDGPYIDPERLAIPASSFRAQDLAQPFSLDRSFDLVQSLEVAEHVGERHAETFVDNLVRHGSLVLFSAALPGQGGEHHINEQPLEYWRRKFAARCYEAFDFLRPRIHLDRAIHACYRFNCLVYAHRDRIAALPAAIRSAHVPADRELPDYLPPALKLRYSLTRCLPQPTIDLIARLKYRVNHGLNRWR